ncbi:MAG: sigma-70 family RNA polymerase sigma factor [Flavobacteriaceae bacterium]
MQSNDEYLWYSFIKGDKSAFATLFTTYYESLYSYGLKISGDPVLTKDSLQDFFVYLFQKRNALGKAESVKAYLFISYRRAILKCVKEKRKHTSNANDLSTIVEFEISAEQLTIKQEITSLKNTVIAKSLNKITPRQREVIYLRYYNNLGIKEIASVMNIEYQSVLNILQKAFTSLKNELQSQSLDILFKEK